MGIRQSDGGKLRTIMTIGKIRLSIFLAVFAVLSPAIPGNGFDFSRHYDTGGGILTLADGQGASVETVKQVHAQFRLVFEYAGAGGTMTAKLYFKGRNEPAVCRIPLEESELFRRKNLSLDGDFRLHDAFFELRKIEFDWEQSSGKIRIRNPRIVPVSEISGKPGPLVCPARRSMPKTYGKNAVRAYFDLDNADLEQSFPYNGALRQDFCPYRGFRDRILEGAEELIRPVESPDDADVIVYSRALPGGSPRIVPALERGARLLLYGTPADAFLLPFTAMELKPLPATNVAKRVTLRPESPSGALRGERPGYDYGRWFDIRLKDGATPLLTDPEGVPAAARKGRVSQFSTGIGCALLDNRGWYDRAFLRAVIGDNPERLARLDEIGAARKETREKQAEAIARRVAGDRWKEFRPGVSEGSFGRFGWCVAEGLQCASLLNDLSVENGTESFRFELDEAPGRIALNEWKARVTAGDVRPAFSPEQEAAPTRSWGGVGTVEWTCPVTIDPVWKGKKLSFLVEKGIDDTDETFFNGRRIGKTDSGVPEYWKKTRRYEIPADAIRYGRKNEIRVVHSNLRGDAVFGSRPVLAVEEENDRSVPELRVTAVNWVFKEYEIRHGVHTTRIRLSLLSPFTQFEFDRPDVELSLEERTAQYAAWPTAAGVRVVPLNGEFYSRGKDGPWSAPWLLLFRRNWENGRPLMLVFRHQPVRLTALRNGNYVKGIRMEARGPFEEIAAGWPWGVKPVNTGKWPKGLPPEITARLNRIQMTALNFPVGCDEVFRIDRAAGKIKVLNRFAFRPMENDWKIQPRAWAVLPPLAAFAADQKLNVVSLPEPVEDFGVAAMHGPLKGMWGKDTISYTLPLYPESSFIPVDVGADPELHAAIDESVAGGSRWSWGGGVRFDELTPAYPQSERRKPWERNICQFSWLYGLGNALQGYYGMNAENKRRIMGRVNARFLKPYELLQYKLQGRYREEPFSKVRYTTTMLSRRALGTNFAPGFGAEFQFGDSNESCTHIAWLARQLGDRMGYAGWVRANWNALKDSMSFSWVMDDWSHLAGSLNDQGSGAWVDMLNGEYAGMMSFARAARIAGDIETEEQALYRAARRAIPTVARFRMKSYLDETLPNSERDRDFVCVGFGEERIHTLEFPCKPDYNFRVSNEMFDFSQGMPGETIELYRSNVLPEVRSYLRNRSEKMLVENGVFLGGGPYLRVFALFGSGGEPLATWRRQLWERNRRTAISDWPGIKAGIEFLPVLWRDHGRISIVGSRGIRLDDAVFHPDGNLLTLRFRAGDDATLRLRSAWKAESVSRNGVEYPFRYDSDGTLPVSLLPGDGTLEVRFPPTSQERTQK